MRICQYSVVLDDSGRNVLVKDSARNYPCLDRLNSPDKVAQLMRDMFQLHERAEEYIYLICVNTNSRPIGFFEVAHGTYNMAPANPREVMVRALLCGAEGIIIVHNHPGGDTTPSRADNEITENLWAAAELIGITFCDHIIIGGWGYYSYKEAGTLEQVG